ncbi:MAG: sigma-70 family RNA polymerase sigma factor [Clostridia bacterium]|nr:sigma-70 family RNA polymerase sigma factor [Clostridia bacterium]
MTEVERLVRAYSATLYRHSLVMLGSPEDAQDVVQETFLRYMKKAPRLNGPDHEKAWLLTVAANLCRNQLRQRRAHPHTPLDSLPEVVSPPTEDTPLLDRLTALPEKVKVVLLLHYVEGYKVREIAQRLHLTQSTVKMRLQKGRQLLKYAYKEEE